MMKESRMPKYIALTSWTDQGVKTARDTVTRYKDAAKAAERMGCTLDDVYWTTGGYDLVVIASAPDDETLAAFLLALAAGGNLRTHTLRAFTTEDMTRVIGMLP
jgi:uncharacterized protein with GYD domain